MLHKQKFTIVSNGSGDSIYVVFVHNKGYVRRKIAWMSKPLTLHGSYDYCDGLIEAARKSL